MSESEQHPWGSVPMPYTGPRRVAPGTGTRDDVNDGTHIRTREEYLADFYPEPSDGADPYAPPKEAA